MSSLELNTSCKFMNPASPFQDPIHKENFGILNIITPEMEPGFDIIRWIFTIDRSGSMEDRCPDGKTKMEHIKHTLNNMITHFLTLETISNITHTLTLIGFDNEVNIICQDELINSELKEKLPTLFQNLEPRGMTNIGKVFDSLSELGDLSKRIQNTQTVHIFMTDGQITSGENNNEKLLEKLNKFNCTNIFIGFGSDHSDKLLRCLSHIPKGEYYFVESLENAGMVYGEIVHNSLYECAENIKIAVENGEIYDYLSNKWSNEISLDSIASNQNKTWHIRQAWLNETSQSNCKIKITCESSQNVSFYQECEPVFPEDGIDKNVEKYWWRQRTQELMNDVSNFIEGGRSSNLQDIRRPLRALNANVEFPLAPPPSPLLRSHNIENTDVIIDAASHNQWDVVWDILDNKPSLINNRHPQRRFSLIHVAAFQGNVSALTNLLERGAMPSVLTEDLLSAKEIAELNNYHLIVEALTQHEEIGPMMERVPRLLSRVLNEFMASMKTYMEENCPKDPFMENLCDDIYVAIRSLNSKLGSMYLGARVLSQGAQRAYNLTNLGQMDDDQYPEPPRLRHNMSQNPNSVYASPQTMDMMASLSSPDPDPDTYPDTYPVLSPTPIPLLRQRSLLTQVDEWEPQYTLIDDNTPV